MSLPRDPRRLADYGGRLDGLLRGALDAERADHVDPSRLAGIEQNVVAALKTAAVSGSDAPSPPAAAPPGGAAVGAKLWLVVGVAVLAGAGAFMASRTEPAPSVSPPVAVAPAAPTIAQPPAPAKTEPEIATISPADLPTAREPVAPKAPPSSASANTNAAEGEEIALLARAHEALHARPAESLALCREHQARFASGHFAQEREAVAIEALVYLGRKAEAEARFGAFRDHFPTSSHRAHLESLFR
jgi:hypothetical protein